MLNVYTRRGNLKRRMVLLAVAALCMVCALFGCKSTNTSDDTEEITDVAVNEHITEDIVERGYLIVGCKTDVPDLSFYDKATNTFSGIEIELAYHIAARLFDVDLETAKSDDLVEFVAVTVDDRETMLKDGSVDVLLATYSITDERAKTFALSESYYTDYIGIMVRDVQTDSNTFDAERFISIAQLDGRYVGIARNSTTRKAFLSYAELMTSDEINPIFCEYKNYPDLYEALLDGDIEAIMVDVSILKGYDDDFTKILDIRFGAQHYGAVALLENAPLIDLINEVIADIG